MPRYDRDPAVAFRLKDGIELGQCGCLHDGKNGHALLVCATHVAAVEGMKGYFRLRNADGELRLVPVFGTTSGRVTDLLTATDVRPDADGLRRPVVPPESGLARPPEETTRARCTKWADHSPGCGSGFTDVPMLVVQKRLREGRTLAVCGADLPQTPPEESLCGEEEALAAGGFGDPEEEAAPLPEQLRAWAQHVRGVGRSRQKAYAEALLLAQIQFDAWQEAFPVAFAAAAKERGWDALGGREEEVLGMFSAGFAGFLGETLRIARDGG